METHDKEIEDTKKNQKDILELKIKWLKSISQWNCLTAKWIQEILIELKDRVIEVTKSEKQRES